MIAIWRCSTIDFSVSELLSLPQHCRGTKPCECLYYWHERYLDDLRIRIFIIVAVELEQFLRILPANLGSISRVDLHVIEPSTSVVEILKGIIN